MDAAFGLPCGGSGSEAKNPISPRGAGDVRTLSLAGGGCRAERMSAVVVEEISVFETGLETNPKVYKYAA